MAVVGRCLAGAALETLVGHFLACLSSGCAGEGVQKKGHNSRRVYYEESVFKKITKLEMKSKVSVSA